MAVVYVKEQGSVVRKRLGRILVEKDGECLLEMTTQVLSELLERGIPLALYTRHGRLKGHLAPELSKNLPLRLAQYKAALDEAAGLRIARPVVRAKLLNSAALVASYRTNYPSQGLAVAQDALREAAEAAAGAASHAELLGHEGSGAAAYFEAFREMNRSELAFEGREKHPAPDPINALLSLGYTLVMREIAGLAEGIGLEPHLGFLHRVDYGRPSLALDLLEAFRPVVVDRLTLRLVNERILTGEDFARRAGGTLAGSVILMPDSFKKYLERYEEAMSGRGIRELLRADVEGLAGALRSGGEFAPYREEGGCST